MMLIVSLCASFRFVLQMWHKYMFLMIADTEILERMSETIDRLHRGLMD